MTTGVQTAIERAFPRALYAAVLSSEARMRPRSSILERARVQGIEFCSDATRVSVHSALGAIRYGMQLSKVSSGHVNEIIAQERPKLQVIFDLRSLEAGALNKRLRESCVRGALGLFETMIRE